MQFLQFWSRFLRGFVLRIPMSFSVVIRAFWVAAITKHSSSPMNELHIYAHFIPWNLSYGQSGVIEDDRRLELLVASKINRYASHLIVSNLIKVFHVRIAMVELGNISWFVQMFLQIHTNSCWGSLPINVTTWQCCLSSFRAQSLNSLWNFPRPDVILCREAEKAEKPIAANPGNQCCWFQRRDVLYALQPFKALDFHDFGGIHG